MQKSIRQVSATIGLHEWTAGPHGRRRVLSAVGGMAVVAALLSPVANARGPISFTGFAMALAASFFAAAVTAVLLVLQGRTLRSQPMIVLGAGFAFTAAAMIPYGAFYPGLVQPLRETLTRFPASSATLWLGWHIALPAAMLSFFSLTAGRADAESVRRRARFTFAAFAAAFVLLLAVAFLDRNLQPVLDGNVFTTRFRVGALVLCGGPGVLVLAAALRSREPTVLEIAIAIVACSGILEAYLLVVGMRPFSVGWWGSRLAMLCATTAVLGILLRQTTRLYGALLRRAEALADEALTDPLTGLSNRRRFDEELQRAHGAAARRNGSLSVAMIDIDHFKRYNDAYGHLAGDAALRRIANAIGESVERSADLAARYGGEEFVVILEDTNREGAIGVAERMRAAVAAAALPAPEGGVLTISVGVATRRPGEGAGELVRRADAALYDAKNAGRNRVVAAREAEQPV
jgi:diguanylate cyclase (GGDEF)-like protein